MRITDLLRPEVANKSLLLGYYGGGNYGDELLLEVLQNLCTKAGIRQITIGYQNPDDYETFHHDFGYPRVDMRNKKAILGAIIRHKQIIIGGGGLWGLDFNFNVLLLSLLLFASRWVFAKKIYLLGIGYYNSTTRFGRLGARLAAKSATVIVARDQETYDNFRKLNPRHTYLDRDIAWYIQPRELTAYRADVAKLDKQLHIDGKTLFVALRRFQAKHQNNFTELVGEFLKNNQDKHIILALLEPERIDPAHYRLISKWEKKYENVQFMREPCNPLGLFLFFHKHRRQLALVAPQFHAIITAHLNQVPFLPIVYDNKVAELLRQIGQTEPLSIKQLNQTTLQTFVNAFYGDTA